jgi:hypothetical protein
MMWRRLLVLDLLLAAVLAFGVVRIRASWNEFQATHRVESIQPEPEPAKNVPPLVVVSAAPGDWTEISVKNPFSFDRQDIPIVAPKQAAPTQPRPLLSGIISIGNENVAMLASAQGGRNSQPIKVGESIDGWEVIEIQDRSVIVSAANGVRETIQMGDVRSRIYDRTGTNLAAGPAVNVVNTTPQAPATPTANSPAPTAAAPQTGFGQPTGEMLQTPFGPVPKTRPQ